MRKLAFGYSTRCNLRCAHCIATEDTAGAGKMDPEQAKATIVALGQAGVGGISFSAGEPFLYFDDMLQLVKLCARIGIYTRMVTNSYWATTEDTARELVSRLKAAGLCQLRLSYSRWHQKGVHRNNVLNAARSCRQSGMACFISFITDFSEKDDSNEQFLRDHGLRFFPEPMIYAGRAGKFKQRPIVTDYQANRCDMNPYLTPDLDMYACCDVGSYFSETRFFHLGNLKTHTPEQLFARYETDRLYQLIRHLGLTDIASFAGMPAREIITYSKCELCLKLFNNPETLERLRSQISRLETWHR